MNDEKKSGSPENAETSCCSVKGKCGCCKGRFLCCLLTGLLLAGAGFGLFQAGKCAGQRCAMPASVSTAK